MTAREQEKGPPCWTGQQTAKTQARCLTTKRNKLYIYMYVKYLLYYIHMNYTYMINIINYIIAIKIIFGFKGDVTLFSVATCCQSWAAAGKGVVTFATL